MFSNFGLGEIAVLALVGLVIFGPDRLPKAAMEAARIIRRLRALADTTVTDFKAELPTELADLDLASLHPRRIIQNALFDDHTATPSGAADRPTDEPVKDAPVPAESVMDESVPDERVQRPSQPPITRQPDAIPAGSTSSDPFVRLLEDGPADRVVHRSIA
jgi:sec-independent protein translocase protein TatB